MAQKVDAWIKSVTSDYPGVGSDDTKLPLANVWFRVARDSYIGDAEVRRLRDIYENQGIGFYAVIVPVGNDWMAQWLLARNLLRQPCRGIQFDVEPFSNYLGSEAGLQGWLENVLELIAQDRGDKELCLTYDPRDHWLDGWDFGRAVSLVDSLAPMVYTGSYAVSASDYPFKEEWGDPVLAVRRARAQCPPEKIWRPILQANAIPSADTIASLKEAVRLGGYPSLFRRGTVPVETWEAIREVGSMAETWLPWCVKRPGPASKQGYPGIPSRTLAQIEGEVKHSAEGSLAATFAVLDNERRIASWHFTLAQNGLVYQHYPLEAITWHAGLPGDRRQDTSLIGNLTLIGEEHEGVVGEPLTHAQLASSIRLSEDVRRLSLGANPPLLRKNLFEHNWLSATNCPSGRIPWEKIIPALGGQEDSITMGQYEELKDRIAKQEKEHDTNRSYRRRASRLVSLSAQLLYYWQPGQAKSQLDTIINFAQDLKGRIDSGQSVP